MPVRSGLTPGFWKNWRNHYTSAQITEILRGTIASSIRDLDDCFVRYAAADPVRHLRAFILANQLTMRLTELRSYPNPSGGNVVGSCTLVYGNQQQQLQNILSAAQAELSTTNRFVQLRLAAILDAFANMRPSVSYNAVGGEATASVSSGLSSQSAVAIGSACALLAVAIIAAVIVRRRKTTSPSSRAAWMLTRSRV
jgi:hypothetical protein